MRGVLFVVGTSIFLFLPLEAVLSLPRGTIAGPVRAEVLRVVDGDTVLVMAEPWPRTYMEVAIRLSDVDAPEVRRGCDTSRLKGIAAADFLTEILMAGVAADEYIAARGPFVTLRNIRRGKYAGRLVADMFNANGDNVATLLLASGHAVPYGQDVPEEC